jgi:hypothetical protein
LTIFRSISIMEKSSKISGGLTFAITELEITILYIDGRT